jgi:hypothetical protein
VARGPPGRGLTKCGLNNEKSLQEEVEQFSVSDLFMFPSLLLFMLCFHFISTSVSLSVSVSISVKNRHEQNLCLCTLTVLHINIYLDCSSSEATPKSTVIL